MNAGDKVRVGVVALDPLRALGLCTILQEALGLECVELSMSEAADDRGLAALLIDGITVPDELLDVVTRFRQQRADIKIVVVGHTAEPEYVQAIISTGVRGYLVETASESELRMAMEVVLDGSVWAPRKVLARLIDAANGSPEDNGGSKSSDRLLDQITPREREVLDLLIGGHSNREIANSLEIDEVTVKAHLGRMLRKAGVSNRVELTLRALEEQGGSSPGRKRA